MRLLGILAGLAAFVATPVLGAPLEAYGRLPAIELAAISPSGKQVAVVATNGEDRAIVVKDLASDQVTFRTDVGSAKIRAVRWAGESDLILVNSLTSSPQGWIEARGEWWKAFVLDLPTRRLTKLEYKTPLRAGTSPSGYEGLDTVNGIPTVRVVDGVPTVLFFGLILKDSAFRLTLFKADRDGRNARIVQIGDYDTSDFTIGVDGSVVAQEIYDDKTGRWLLKVKQGAAWRTAHEVVAAHDAPSLLGLGRDGQTVIFRDGDAVDKPVWREVSLADASVSSGVEIAPYQGAVRDPQDGRLVGNYALIGDEGRYSFFNETDARAWRSVRAAFPDSIVGLESWSIDHRKVVVSVDSPTEGPGYALVDLDAKTANWLGQSYLGLNPEDLGPRKAVRFKAADGLQLSGYLTLPPDRDAKGLPLIVFPHGGPASRDEPGFDWWAQAMASRGYAVLQVNFRGSEGFGQSHLTAGYGQWGRKMQTDLSDGVRYLAGQGIIDPKRVCIVGASYGGYAALAGPTMDSGVYRCAVSVAGVSDLPRMIAKVSIEDGRSTTRYWKRFMGADPAAVSPAQLAAKADAPILLIHGKDDTVVPLEQSQIMDAALTKAGKPHEFLLMKGEDHWLSRGETRLEMLKATMAFVEKHNPPS